MLINHVAVFLENRQGRLSDFCRVISDAGLNQLATSIADTKDFGILRTVTDDNVKAIEALKNAGFTVASVDLIGVAVEDRTGGLTELLKILDSEGVNIEYMYSYRSKDNKALIIFKVGDTDKAITLIKKHNLEIVGKEVF